jgi:hypothetical protein
LHSSFVSNIFQHFTFPGFPFILILTFTALYQYIQNIWNISNKPARTYPSLAGCGGWICLDEAPCCLSSLMEVDPGWLTCTPWSIVGDFRVMSDGVAEREDPLIRSRTDITTLEFPTTVHHQRVLAVNDQGRN